MRAVSTYVQSKEMTAILSCARCKKPLRECCDLYEEATDMQGRDVVLCGECVAEMDESDELGDAEPEK